MATTEVTSHALDRYAERIENIDDKRQILRRIRALVDSYCFDGEPPGTFTIEGTKSGPRMIVWLRKQPTGKLVVITVYPATGHQLTALMVKDEWRNKERV